LQDAAAQRFRKYTKAKRAKEAIAERLKVLEAEILLIEQHEQQLEQIARDRNEKALDEFDQPARAAGPKRNRQEREQQIPGVRRYLSTDGYEILVGRAAKDNDHLTFRVARPNDLWLHAGDYPGSHVVVRNPTRKEIPQRTMIEAAQLAARFSQASEDAKVVIHYTERKFLSKPKGAAPGLVRLSSFRSITVEPKEAIQRL
jgi:predicted ribosome quality control (RQC) complex YloA/Tae2 family protein